VKHNIDQLALDTDKKRAQRAAAKYNAEQRKLYSKGDSVTKPTRDGTIISSHIESTNTLMHQIRKGTKNSLDVSTGYKNGLRQMRKSKIRTAGHNNDYSIHYSYNHGLSNKKSEITDECLHTEPHGSTFCNNYPSHSIEFN
jgi:hypothetical protein